MNESLETLLADGIIEAVIGQLKTGKEAEVWLVQHAGQVVAAKLYKERHERNFRNNVGYREGREVRNSRTRRAMEKGSRFGQEAAEEAWKSAESDSLYKLHAQGVRVPTPVMFYEGILLMELVLDAEGHPAPRLVEAPPATPEDAQAMYLDLRAQVIQMLCADLIHGDLSPYNILMGSGGPTIIDFPQTVAAARNNRAEFYFRRDLDNVREFLAGFAPWLRGAHGDTGEIWQAYVRRDLTPEFVPSGNFRDAPRRNGRGGPRGNRFDGGEPRRDFRAAPVEPVVEAAPKPPMTPEEAAEAELLELEALVLRQGGGERGKPPAAPAPRGGRNRGPGGRPPPRFGNNRPAPQGARPMGGNGPRPAGTDARGGGNGRPAASNDTRGGNGRPAPGSDTRGANGRPAPGSDARGANGRPASSNDARGGNGRPASSNDARGGNGRPATNDTRGANGRPAPGYDTHGANGHPASNDARGGNGRPAPGYDTHGANGHPASNDARGGNGRPASNDARGGNGRPASGYDTHGANGHPASNDARGGNGRPASNDARGGNGRPASGYDTHGANGHPASNDARGGNGRSASNEVRGGQSPNAPRNGGPRPPQMGRREGGNTHRPANEPRHTNGTASAPDEQSQGTSFEGNGRPPSNPGRNSRPPRGNDARFNGNGRPPRDERRNGGPPANGNGRPAHDAPRGGDAPFRAEGPSSPDALNGNPGHPDTRRPVGDEPRGPGNGRPPRGEWRGNGGRGNAPVVEMRSATSTPPSAGGPSEREFRPNNQGPRQPRGNGNRGSGGRGQRSSPQVSYVARSNNPSDPGPTETGS
ncbi:hypothetical protein LZ198_01165 [Myxococcus sp. K15C18031901]|uniref:RIO1 family regulatory kinase/ATPase domain-containing protein n=1 Tax=Myxococcus dinghuensis TaxID=2906761 RepID=UPI0020A80F25|nr:RIO1 family regulatory kinase/ATPase [Myxococcus dinghuensis]MCP3097477.1 hypothetical protein [Myxococcus dinghuensis]